MTTTQEPPAVAGPLGQRGRASRPRGPRLSGGHLLMIVAALVAVVANYAVLRGADDAVRVAVADRELPAGDPVTADAFGFTELSVDDRLLATLLTPAALAEVEGWVPISTIEAGALMRLSDLQRPSAPRSQRAMSIPIEAAHAVAGALRPGDRVDVIEVEGRSAGYLVTDAEVLDVPPATATGIQAGLGTFSVTIAVDDRTALELAVAIRSGQLEIVRSTGSEPAAVWEVDRAPADPDGGESTP